MAAAGAGSLRRFVAFRDRSRTALDVVVVLAVAASLLSQWTIAIQPAHLAETFGFESPACWLECAALLAALVLEVRAAVIALAIAELVLVAWFGWATWVVTTPRFTDLPFPFMATDIMGAGWYGAAIGLVADAGALVWELRRRHAPLREDLWLLTAIPGFGLMRLGRWVRGLAWAALFCGAFYFASTDSPDSTLFADYGRTNNVPPPFPRGAEWVLLATAAVFWVVSVVLTVRQAGMVLERK